MAYVLKKTNGTTLTTIEDGTINSSSAPITLVGRNYSGYGQSINQNLIKMVENFAYNVQPSNPLTGQLWYDTDNKCLKAFNGTRFKPIAYVDTATGSPVDSVTGDLWFNESEQKLYFYNGTNYVLIGPQFTGLASNNLILPAIVRDNAGIDHYILKHQIQNAVDESLSTVAISSADEFTPSATIVGFPTIKKGITLPNVNNLGVSSAPTNTSYLWGTASDSLRLGGSAATDYVLKAAPAFTEQVLVNTVAGISIRSGALRFHIDQTDPSTANISLGNESTSGNTLKFNLLVSSTLVEIIRLTSSGNLAILPNSETSSRPVNIGASDRRFSTAYVRNINVESGVSSATGTFTGEVAAETVTASKAMTTAYYANAGARDTAITAPVTGMIVLVGTHFQGYDGVSWVNLNV